MASAPTEPLLALFGLTAIEDILWIYGAITVTNGLDCQTALILFLITLMARMDSVSNRETNTVALCYRGRLLECQWKPCRRMR